MNPLALSPNPSDTLVAGLLVGTFFGLVGAGLIWFTCSLWAERQARNAEATVTETPEARRQRLFDAECDIALTVAESQVQAHRKLAAVAPVVPLQRDGRWS